jgi:hypothetical protein
MMDEYSYKSAVELRYDDYLTSHVGHPLEGVDVSFQQSAKSTEHSRDNDKNKHVSDDGNVIHINDMIDDGYGWYPFTLCQSSSNHITHIYVAPLII